MWMNSNQTSNSGPSVGRWSNDQLSNNQSFRSFGSSAGSLALSTQQKALITSLKSKNDAKEKLASASPLSGHRTLSRTTSSGIYPTMGSRPSALSQHRALQRSSSYDPNRLSQNIQPTLGSRSSGLSSSNSTAPPAGNTSTNGYRSRETGVVEKLLLSYGFIKCADREGRLFFHYSQFHGEAHSLNINDEVEFDVSMDTRTGKPVAVQVVKLKKGTVVFEVYSEERILGEIATPVLQSGASSPPSSASVNGMKAGEKGEPCALSRYGSLCYDRMGEVFYLPYSVNDLTNKAVQLQPRDKVSFYIATEKRTGALRARKITLVERAPPKRFIGIVTALKESFGFIERGDVVKEIFFHYSEVNANVPDLHIGDHVEYSIQDRNSKEVATCVRLLPPGTVQLEDFSDDMFTGTVEKPLPPKAPNKLQQPQISNAAGDATVVSKVNGNVALQTQQPSVTLAGVIQYVTPLGESRKIRFGEKDRAANCSYTLRQGDKVSFFTVTDTRNGQQRAAGVSLLLQESLEISKEKRERGIVAAVKEGFGFIKCLERDSRLFFHCCELLDSNYNIRMSDEVEFTVLNDPVAEKHRLHATRITILQKGTVIFHTISDITYTGEVGSLPGSQTSVEPDCLVSPALGPNPGFLTFQDPEDAIVKVPFTFKEFAEWTDAALSTVGSKVEFQICTVRRTGAKNAVDIKLLEGPKCDTPEKSTQEVVKDIVSNMHLADSSSPTLSQGSPTSTDPVFSTPETATATRIPIVASTSFISVIDEVSLPAPSFGANAAPKSQSVNDGKLVNSSRLNRDVHDNSPRINRELHDRSPSSSSDGKSKSPRSGPMNLEKSLGWISTLKETFGFIETADHTSEIFFHFSEFQDSQEKFNINTPVTYFKGLKEDKPCAMMVSIAREKDLVEEEIDPTVYEGVITKPLKSGGPGQLSYQGLISYDKGTEIKVSPLGMIDRRDFIQVGDKVNFQMCTNLGNGQIRAVNVSVKREIIQATVESVKGEYGFINYEVKNTDAIGSCKLFFHMSEVREGADELAIGSLVEFSVIFNQRTGKYSAIGVRCLESKRQRPERLRLRSSCCEPLGPIVTVTRQPRGPSGDKGFTLKRTVSNAEAEMQQLQVSE